MREAINQPMFDFLSEADKDFIVAFDRAMLEAGYVCPGGIGSGFCWGMCMIVYQKAGVKAKKVAARIYIRESGITLRLFFSDIDRHAAFIEAAPGHIQEAFTGEYGNCKHCKGDACHFRKVYTLYGRRIEKCNGTTFQYPAPTVEKLPDYLSLFREFYGKKEKEA